MTIVVCVCGVLLRFSCCYCFFLHSVYAPWRGYLTHVVQPEDSGGYGGYVVIRQQRCNDGRDVDETRYVIMIAGLDNNLTEADVGTCLGTLDIENTLGKVDSAGELYIRYQRRNVFETGETFEVFDPEPCIHETGRIFVGDASSVTLLSSDDAFKVYVDDNFRGETAAGESDVFIFNPLIGTGRTYPDEGYKLELEVSVAPDGWGTHYVEFFSDQYLFASGEKVNEEDIFGGDVGDTVTFDNVVCVENDA